MKIQKSASGMNILKIIILILVLSSCKKDKPIPVPTEETTITLTGKIVLNCAGATPLSTNSE